MTTDILSRMMDDVSRRFETHEQKIRRRTARAYEDPQATETESDNERSGDGETEQCDNERSGEDVDMKSTELRVPIRLDFAELKRYKTSYDSSKIYDINQDGTIKKQPVLAGWIRIQENKGLKGLEEIPTDFMIQWQYLPLADEIKTWMDHKYTVRAYSKKKSLVIAFGPLEQDDIESIYLLSKAAKQASEEHMAAKKRKREFEVQEHVKRQLIF